MASGYYPAGAEFDPRAPYNEPDDREIYDKAYEKIKNELDNNEEPYINWISEIINLDLYYDQLEEISTSLSKINSIRDSYESYRLEDAVQECVDSFMED